MCYRTLAGVLYKCSFAAIKARLRGTDLLDPVDVECTVDFVDQGLETREREELCGTGELTREYADLRLRGAVRELEMTDRQARHHRAPARFLAAIGDSLHEARRALAVAEAYKASKEPKEPPPQDWSMKPIPGEDDAPMHAVVTTDDLLAALNGVGAVSRRPS